LPVSLSRLRIAGFKSFAEPASLEILPGLTGIVGPNGCGKSNVVEALRWAMGESSARSLRGGEMDDVIFAGTANRPSRNLAEVAVLLQEAAGLAPAPFQEAAELEVVRRIERGVGSAYRINGREVRARDVQTLFADLATGARASAMVSQGRVGALVQARPDERRAILEEAAGITGLHARRHEAELKLRAAEANLERAEAQRAQLADRLDALTRQARQAARFRALRDLIRRAEAELLSVQRALAERGRAAAQAAHDAAAQQAEAARHAARAAAIQAESAADGLPELRAQEGQARIAQERARLEAAQAEAEARRAAQALAEAAGRAAQARADLAHAGQAAGDAEAALRRLAEEQSRLRAETAPDPEALAAAVSRAEAALAEAEAEAQRSGERAAGLAAARRAAEAALAAAAGRADRARQLAAARVAERERARQAAVSPATLHETEAAAAAAHAALLAARAAHEAAEQTAADARSKAGAARDAAQAAQGERGRLHAAAHGLEEALGAPRADAARRMIDAIAVPDGFEAALGSTLGEDLEASADTRDAQHWRVLPPCPEALPAGVTPFLEHISAPEALWRALSQAGLVADAAQGAALQPALRPGQSLATRQGDVFRWDGFTTRAGAPAGATVRLQQRNRLAALRIRLAEAEQAAATTAEARAQAETAERAAAETEQRLRAAARAAEQAEQRARDSHAALAGRAAITAATLAAAAAAVSHAETEDAEAAAARAASQAALDALADPAVARAAADAARAALAQARTAAEVARQARDTQLAAEATRRSRLAALDTDLAAWRSRAADAASRLRDLQTRAAEAAAAHEALGDRPAALAAARAEAEVAAQAAQAAHRRAAEAVQLAEDAAAAAERTARAADAAQAAARETLVRTEAELAHAEAVWGAVAERVLRFGQALPGAPAAPAAPTAPDTPAALEADAEERARRRLERLQREHETFGPVNMQAETEAGEIAAQVESIAREAAELTSAIAKLRGSIGHINREGRERLGQVFADIDRHFRALFETMFGGGRAHLALVGSDDPLLAGLEIFAQPPGKKLATLSLLSGGEQALTALSLIFAVFRCNPAPVCVLDEVDAPLDDANVDRFCELVRAMVRETGTRFLVVTHHQLTMARMDRLYGVTMQERGISRLLSVDLSRAVALAEQVPLAAE
jgi:chromosome segregation protein